MGCSLSSETIGFSSKYSRKVSGTRRDLFLGRGSFGRVVLVEEKVSRETRALKIVKKTAKSIAELKVMKKLPAHHPNILMLYDSFETSKSLMIVLELASGGDLLGRVNSSGKILSDELSACAVGQISRALECMHELAIAHRDIKPENVLLADTFGFLLKVADFGCSKIVEGERRMKSFVGTKAYAAPEILRGEEYDFSCDVYSLGILLALLLTGKHPFSKISLDAQFALASRDLTHLIQFDSDCWTHVSDEATGLLKRLAHTTPSKRPTPAEILETGWIVQNLDAGDRTSSSSLEESAASNRLLHLLRETTCGDDIQKVAMRLLARQTDQHVEALSESIRFSDALFDRLDEDRTGLVRRTELRKAAKYAKISVRSLDVAFDNADLDESGVVERDELRASLLASQPKLLASLVDFAFDKMDVSRSGLVSPKDVALVAKRQLNLSLDENRLDALIKTHYSKDGLLDKHHFQQMLLKTEKSRATTTTTPTQTK